MNSQLRSDQPTSDRPKEYEVIRQGFDVLQDPEKASVDIVAVPGLGANPLSSWTHPESKFNWLSDKKGLAKDFPSARVLLCQYGSAWKGSLKVKQFLDDIAETLLNALMSKREGYGRRPIVFIGHSMGGLVITKTICLAGSDFDKFPMVHEAVSGCIFFGTPFGGAPVASIAAMYASVAQSFGTAESSALLKIMKPGTEYLRELKKDFLRLAVKLSEKIEITCVWEIDPTNFAKMAGVDWNIVSKAFEFVMPKSAKQLVSKESSTLTGHDEFGLHKAHRNLVQFKDFKDEQYQIIRTPLKRIIHGAPLVAKNRFSSTKGIDREAIRNILNALEGVHVQKKYDTLKAKLVSQSWILQEREYLDWLTIDANHESAHREGCLWIRGPVGKGKSSASIAAIEQIDKLATDADSRNASPILFAFFFCDKSTECSSAEELLKSIVRQLISQQETLAAYARHLTKKKAKGQDANSASQSKSQAGLTVENLWQSLQDMFSDNMIGTIYIIVNNLHELPENDTSAIAFLSLLQEELVNMNRNDRKVQIRWLFTSRDRHYLGKALPQQKICLINLDEKIYNTKVQSDVQMHAQMKVAELQKEKKYNMALSYFASSLVGRRAETTKWVDVTCVHLAALPSNANDLQVRRLLEEVPQDIKALLDRAWLSLLGKKDEDTARIKEMLRALVLTYEDLSEEELALLAGFSSSPERRDEVQRLIEKCSPLLRKDVLDDGKQVVSFVNEDVKLHLKTYIEELLGLSEEGERWQQGMIALRCFTYLLTALAGAKLSTLDKKSEDAEVSVAPDDLTCSEAVDGENVARESEHQNSENDHVSIDSAVPEVWNYPVMYWLRHASKATSDIAGILSKQEQFWEPNSKIRSIWLEKYSNKNDSFEDVETENWKALHVAAAIDYPQLTVSLIEHGHHDEIGEHNSENWTPLHVAACFGRSSVVEELLDRGAKINDGDGKAGTPLMLAATAGEIDVMAKLLQREGINPCASQDGWPVINGAIASGKVEAVKMLLDKGATLSLGQETDGDGNPIPSPLAFSAKFSDLAIFNHLMEEGRDGLTDKEYDEAFITAATTDRSDVLNKLLEVPSRLESFQEALIQAVEEESWDAVKILLERSGRALNCKHAFEAAVNSRVEVPQVLEAIWNHTGGGIPGIAKEKVNECLYKATDDEKAFTVKILLDKYGGDPNAMGEEFGNALTAAANDGTEDIIMMLLNKGADINAECGWALKAAAAQGHIAVVELLLNKGAEKDACSEGIFPGTALQAACESGWLDIVKVLLARGADPNLGCGLFSCPIIVATRKGEVEILNELLKAPDLEVNVFGGEDGSTPLINAAFTCPTESLQQLVAKGADVNLADPDGDTALIAAARVGDLELVGFLLEVGANILHVSKRNQTALEVAMESDNLDCVYYLAVRASSVEHHESAARINSIWKSRRS